MSEDQPGGNRADTAFQLGLLQASLEALASAGDSRAAIRVVLEELCRATGWVYGEAWLPAPNGHLVRQESHVCLAPSPALDEFARASPAHSLALGVGLPGRAWASKTAAWLPDVAADPSFQRTEAAVRAGLRTGIAIPVLARGDVVAIVSFFSTTSRTEDPQLVDLVASVPRQLGPFIQRQQAEERLRDSEARFRSVAESARDAIVTTDATDQIRYVNASAEHLFSYAPGELLGQSLTVIMPERFRAAHLQGFARFIATGEGRLIGKTIELVGLRKDGSEFPVELSLATWTTREGVFVTGVIRDITERKRAEEEHVGRLAAELASRRAALLARLSRVLAESLDYRETLTRLAQAVVPELADWAAVDVVEEGRLVPLASAHEDATRTYALDDLRHPGSPGSAFPGADNAVESGEPHWIAAVTDPALVERGIRSFICAPLKARGRKLGALVLVMAHSGRNYTAAEKELAVEIAARAGLAADNARLYGEVQEANRLKDEFLAILSHELRTPLNAILGWSGLLQAGALDAVTQRRALDAVRRNAEAQTRIISDILDVSRIMTGKIRLELQDVSLAEVVDSALDTVRSMAETKRLDIEATVDSEARNITGDPDRLRQVVWNLLANAVKFTPEGGRVRARVLREGAKVKLIVEDTGPGIPPSFLSHLFQRFRQADSSSTRGYRGLGLGLAIVRHIVELHGGGVVAENRAGGPGAVFTVTLPVRCIGSAGVVTPRARPGRAIDGVLDGRRVLAVDDDRDALELLEAVLQRAGARVTAALSGADALDFLREARPDVLLLDIEMPGEDGYALLRRIRARSSEEGGLTPAVALTAYAGHANRVRALEAGFQAHVGKPFRPEDLVDLIAELAGATPDRAP